MSERKLRIGADAGREEPSGRTGFRPNTLRVVLDPEVIDVQEDNTGSTISLQDDDAALLGSDLRPADTKERALGDFTTTAAILPPRALGDSSSAPLEPVSLWRCSP